jgi:Type II secretion system (T2SS), protein M
MLERLAQALAPVSVWIWAAWTAGTAQIRGAAGPAFAAARLRYRKLEQRERVLVQIAGALVAIFILFNLVYLPIQRAIGGLGDRIQERQHDAVEVARMMRNYHRLHIDLATMRSRTVPPSGNFSLFSIVEQTLTRAPGKEKIGSITPAEKLIPGGMKQYSVELKLNALTLPQVVDTLYGLNSLSIPVTVSNLHITRLSQATHTFDVELTCVALGRNG